MAASPVLGSPQWANVRTVTPSTAAVPYYDTSGQGLYNITPFSASVAASHTITAGPQTVGPVFIQVQGTVWILPMNSSVSVPDFVVKALDSTQWTYL